MAELIKGSDVAKKLKGEIAAELEHLKAKINKIPGLAVVLVGDDPASQSYVENKEKTSRELGFYSEVHRLPNEAAQTELLELIDKLNRDKKINGILVQLPLPGHINENAVIDALSPEKDVDGFHPINVGSLFIGEDSFVPCTPYGIIKMLEYIDYDLKGKHAVVIGRSNIVGKPVLLLLLREHATVTLCHSQTEDLPEICRGADVLVVAVGQPEMVKGDWIKQGAVVIDAGVNRVGNKLVGDVEFESARKAAGFITPVPGGVGPITITMLMLNTLKAFKRANNL